MKKFIETWKVNIYCHACGKVLNDESHHEFEKENYSKHKFTKANFNYRCPCGSIKFYLTGLDYTVLED